MLEASKEQEHGIERRFWDASRKTSIRSFIPPALLPFPGTVALSAAMRFRRVFTALAIASTLGRAEPVDPRIIARYKQLLASNPTEGIALDRLWKAAVEDGSTEKLVAEFRAGGTFSSEMIVGHLLRRSGKESAAAEAFHRAGKLDPTSPLPFLAIAALETERTQPQMAAKALENAVALLEADDPRLPDTLIQLGAAWFSAGEPARAAAAWESTVEKNPRDLALRRRLADSYRAGLLYDKAIVHLEFIAGNAPVAERATALQEIARLYSGVGKPAEAIAALEKAVALTAPGNWLRTELNGQIIRLAQRQHIEDALEKKWSQDAEANPRDLGAALRLVEFYERTGALGLQQQWLERVISLVPKSTEHRLRLARVLMQLDDLAAAAKQLDLLLESQPNDPDLVLERARLDLQREDGDGARKRIGAMIAAKKPDDSVRAKVLEFYQQNRLFDLAEETLKTDAVSGNSDSLQSLAAFYFAQKRESDALSTLGRLVRPGDAPAARAAAHFQIAQSLKLQSALSAAADQARQAAQLAPDVREYHMMLGELLTSSGYGQQARAPLERAWELSKNDAERLEADQKLFGSFRAAIVTPGEDAPEMTPRRINSVVAAVADYIRPMMTRATMTKASADWLRIARWTAWNGDKGSAKTYATKASELEPENPQPLEFMAQQAASAGDHASAVKSLRALAVLHPANRDSYLRQTAQLEALSGNAREAVRIFEDIAKRNPGNPDALSDLANAEERNGQLVESLASWRRAHSIAPPQRKRELSAAILRILQQQSKHEEASDLLLRMVDETPDDKEKAARFDELLLHAQQRNQMQWLREKLEQRRKVQADDYFTALAYGRVLKMLGEKAAAFEVFADAVFSAPNQEQALPDLIREAEELRKLDTAIRLQEQLTRVVNQERPDGFLKLAALQEKTGDLDGAERTWGRATAKFPRDFEVIRRAADFHLAWGDTARATLLLRKLTALDPASLRSAVELGVMEKRAGNFDGSKTAFESVLKLSKPVANLTLFPTNTGENPWTERVSFERGSAGSGTIFSGSGRAEVRNAWMAGEMIAISPSHARMDSPERPSLLIKPGRSAAAVAQLPPEAEWRLLAIRGAAEACQKLGGAALGEWIRGWKESAAANANEAIWALFFAGDTAAALDLIEESWKAKPGDLALTQAFVSMALETNDFARLSRWLEDESRFAIHRQTFSIAFADRMQKRGAFSSEEAARLFPQWATARLWTSATHIATHRNYAPAIALGSRAAKLFETDAAFANREMARWNLPLGKADESRRLLAIASASPADSFESPALASLVELHHLLSFDARPAFLAEGLAKLKDDGLQDLFRRTILLRLTGQREAARAELHRILDRHPLGQSGLDRSNSAHRELLWLAGAADAFVQWDMPDLAAAVWARTLADPGLAGAKTRLPARESVEGSRAGMMWARTDTVEDIFDAAANQLDALRYATGGPVEKAEILAERIRAAMQSGLPQSGRVVADPNDRDEPLLSLAEALRSLQAWPSAVEVCERAWELNHESPRVLRELLDSCTRAGDDVTAEHVRRRCVEDRINPGGDSTLRQFAIDLADQLERRGAVDEGMRVISGALDGSPGDFALLRRQAQLYMRAGKNAEAESVLRKLSRMDGGTAVARGQLAVLLEQQGKLAESLEVRIRRGALDTRAPILLFKSGRLDEAIVMLEKFSGLTVIEPASELATAMALSGDLNGARSVLISLLGRIADPRAQFLLRGKILALPGPPASAEFVGRMKERMQALADTRSELTSRYYEFFQQQAGRLGIAEAWKGEVSAASQRKDGPVEAAFALLHAQLSAKDPEARKTLDSVLARATSAKFPIAQLMLTLEQFDQPELRLPVAKCALDLATPSSGPLEEYVELLDSLGRREDARAALTQHEWLSAFSGNALVLARLWMSLGETERAREFCELALKERPMSSQSPALALMAQVQAALGNREAAAILFRRAFSQPSFRDFAPFVDYLSRGGELNRWHTIATEFGVRPALLHDLKIALFAHYERHLRATEALGLVTANPEMIAPVSQRISTGAKAPVTFARLRALVKMTGEFKAATDALDALRKTGAPDVEPEFSMLQAEWSLAKHEAEAATPHFIAAAKLRPANWEYVRRAAEAHLTNAQKAEAKELLEKFITAPQAPGNRDTAVALWETASRAK